jgi:hypothetical protein
MKLTGRTMISVVVLLPPGWPLIPFFTSLQPQNKGRYTQESSPKECHLAPKPVGIRHVTIYSNISVHVTNAQQRHFTDRIHLSIYPHEYTLSTSLA